jgi:hypothetical protein
MGNAINALKRVPAKTSNRIAFWSTGYSSFLFDAYIVTADYMPKFFINNFSWLNTYTGEFGGIRGAKFA